MENQKMNLFDFNKKKTVSIIYFLPKAFGVDTWIKLTRKPINESKNFNSKIGTKIFQFKFLNNAIYKQAQPTKIKQEEVVTKL